MADATPGEDDAHTRSVPRIVCTDDVLGGNPRIEGRRIGVNLIYRRYTEQNDGPATIAGDYDLSVAAVHAALAYAFANREEMDAIERRTAELREMTETLTPPES